MGLTNRDPFREARKKDLEKVMAGERVISEEENIQCNYCKNTAVTTRFSKEGAVVPLCSNCLRVWSESS